MDPITDKICEVLLLRNVSGVSAAQLAEPVRDLVRKAVNLSCSCGGKPLGDGCCEACEVWHRLQVRT